MKKLDMEKISRLILKAMRKLVVVDSTLIYYGQKKKRWTRLHMAYITGVGIPVRWKVDSSPDWEVGKEFLWLNPMRIIADRGYWVWDFFVQVSEEGRLRYIVKPRRTKR